MPRVFLCNCARFNLSNIARRISQIICAATVIRCMNGKVTQLVTDFFQLRIRSLFLIQPFGKFHLQALNRG